MDAGNVDNAQPDSGTSQAPWRVYNIGNNNQVELMDYIGAIESAPGRKAEIEMLPLKPGDVVVPAKARNAAPELAFGQKLLE